MEFQYSSYLGMRNESFDDSRSNIASATSGSSPSGSNRSLEVEGASMHAGGVIMNGSRACSGMSEILSLLGTLGEGYRLSCLYRCQVQLVCG